MAVFYDRDFYVGQVLQVHNPDLSDVTFMISAGNLAKLLQNMFGFGFEVVPKNGTWQIDGVRWGVLLACWNAFKKLFVYS